MGLLRSKWVIKNTGGPGRVDGMPVGIDENRLSQQENKAAGSLREGPWSRRNGVAPAGRSRKLWDIVRGQSLPGYGSRNTLSHQAVSRCSPCLLGSCVWDGPGLAGWAAGKCVGECSRVNSSNQKIMFPKHGQIRSYSRPGLGAGHPKKPPPMHRSRESRIAICHQPVSRTRLWPAQLLCPQFSKRFLTL
jgi:hypothetical protein